jgi:two-component system nitrogen regulation response regulator NtrX
MAHTPTVLVLDDDAGVRTSMALLLQVNGYQAVTASTLDEARTLLETTSIQALILDVGLKDGGTGLELLRTIRERPEFDKAPILVLTGGVLAPSEEMLITRKRAFLFYKPEGFDTLVKFLDELTGRDRPH